METRDFKLAFIRQETHLLLPSVTSIIVTQHLYDILFQYVVDPAKEEKLQHFINLLETHIKSKPRTPFAMPLTELEFLNEGLQELKLLNWMEIDLTLFEIEPVGKDSLNEKEMEDIIQLLEKLFTFKHSPGSNQIWVFPQRLTIL